MCCLFGIMDCDNNLSVRQRTRIFSVLASCCEVRGTDATGIAYHTNGHLTVYKRPRPAHRMHFRLPTDANIIMGHTRMTTQGNEKFNYNNHPFYGKVGNTTFALAHNGILHNDSELKQKYDLPKTNIETDSYVAVQLLEKEKALSFQSIASMAEELQGSFTLTVLNNEENLYFIKGDNPMCIYYWEPFNLYLYASTEEILKTALLKIPYYFGKEEQLELHEGDILRIDKAGKRSTGQFSIHNLGYSAYFRYSYPWEDEEKDPNTFRTGESYYELLRSMATTFGYRPQDVDTLLAEGFSPVEIEKLFYENEDYC